MIKSKFRPYIVQTTLSEEEHALVKLQAASEGLSITAWIRRTVMMVLKQTRPEGMEPRKSPDEPNQT